MVQNNILPAEVPPLPGEEGVESCSEDSQDDMEVGWGPDRPLYVENAPIGYGLLNSTDSENWGDERNFLVIDTEAGLADTDRPYRDRIEAKRDETYVVAMRVHVAGPGEYELREVTAKFNLPTCTGH